MTQDPSGPAPRRFVSRPMAFYAGFLVVALLLAGVVSYAASGSPDGLEAVTQTGCQLDESGQPTGGQCIAQNAGQHVTAGSPLADYTVGGAAGTTGVAGVIGVLATLVVAAGLFWLVRRRRRGAELDDRGGRARDENPSRVE